MGAMCKQPRICPERPPISMAQLLHNTQTTISTHSHKSALLADCFFVHACVVLIDTTMGNNSSRKSTVVVKENNSFNQQFFTHILPYDIWMYMLENFFTPYDMCKISLVCKELHRL